MIVLYPYIFFNYDLRLVNLIGSTYSSGYRKQMENIGETFSEDKCRPGYYIQGYSELMLFRVFQSLLEGQKIIQRILYCISKEIFE